MSDDGTGEDLLTQFVSMMQRAYQPLVDIAASSASASEALARLGVDAPAQLTTAQLDQLVSDLGQAADKLSLDGDSQEMLASVGEAAAGVEQAMSAAFPPELARALLDRLLIRLLQVEFPRLNATLALLGLITARQVAPPEASIQFVSWRMEWERFPLLFKDPQALFEAAYGWGIPEFDPTSVMRNLRNFFLMMGIPAGLHSTDQDGVRAMGASLEVDPVLRVPLFLLRDGIVYAEVGLAVLALRQTSGPVEYYDGLAVAPFGVGELRGDIDLGAGWSLSAGIRGEGVGGIGLSVRPTSVDFGMLDGSNANQLELASTLELSKGGGEKRTVLFGEPVGTRFEVGSVGIGGEMALRLGAEPSLGAEAFIRNSQLVIAPGQDAFLQIVLPPDGIIANFDFLLGWSTERSIYFEGSGGLELTIPLHLEIGPITIESIYLAAGLNFNTGETEFAGALSIGAEIGPFAASVNRLGIILRTELSSAPRVTPAFLPPLGAGFAMDAGVTGGGFLEFDDINERYAGILALKFGEIGITAIGLITTKMPDGSKGFSMLVNIGVVFDPPIQLSMGFTLSGVGGLIGINRTMMIDVLREGVKNRTLDSILFPEPEWVIPNAAKVISDLRAVFPPEEGRFVVGPMVKIGYGSPNIIIADIGVFLELFDPIRIVLLGQLSMQLPEPKDAVVRINLDVVGVLDFEKKELSFQASLYDSGILTFELYGDAAFFLSWGAQPEFAMSLGGFHPRFTPPPPPIVFADLRRLGLNLSSGSDFQLSCEVYQALTPNSLQFGARADLYAAACGAEVTGYLGFDTLIYFSPFSFEIDLGAGVTIRYQGMTLADIHVEMNLSGPTPWNARGTATIKVLFFDVDVDFEVTWGRDDAARIAAVDPWPRLEQALMRAESWGSQLPPSASMVESLRKIEDEVVIADDGQELPVPVLVHPAGSLEIRQNVAPLETTLEKFGNAPLKEHDQFRIESMTTADDVDLQKQSVNEFFARGQFERLSNSRKLSVPSFEKMPGGVASTSSHMSIACEVRAAKLQYESILIKPDLTSMTPPEATQEQATVEWGQAKFLTAGAAPRRCALRSEGQARFAHAGPGLVGTTEEKYVIVDSATLEETGLGEPVEGSMTRMQADRALREHLRSNPEQAGSLLVVGEYEVEEAA